MKPFDLKKALEGELLITRDGKNKNLKITNFYLGSEFNVGKLQFPILTNNQGKYTIEGNYAFNDINQDLFMQEDSDLTNNEDNNLTFVALPVLKDLLKQLINNLENNHVKQNR